MNREAPMLQVQAEAEQAESFPFVGGLLALDLVNTEVVVRGRRRDLLASPQDAARWWAESSAHHHGAPTTPAAAFFAQSGSAWLGELCSLRGTLRALFAQVVNGVPVEEPVLAALNGWLAFGRAQLAQETTGGFGEHFAIDGGSEAAALFTIAHTALTFLSTGDLSRLHRCDNPRCILYFVDTTKSATRRWCSNGCMNRARSAQRYAALRANESDG